MMDYVKLSKVIDSSETTTQKENADRYRKLFYAKLLRLNESSVKKDRKQEVFSVVFACCGFVSVVLALVV